MYKDPEARKAANKRWAQSERGKAWLKQYAKQYRESNKEKVAEWAKKVRIHGRAKFNEWRRLDRKTNRDKAKNKYLREKYGITLEEFTEMEKRQQGACAICLKVTKLSVDHCHSSGRVRSLLCLHCNSIVGLCGENPAILAACIRYIKGQRLAEL